MGCGRVGSALAKLLDADGHEIIVVDENPTAFKRLGQNFKGHVVVGTGIDYDVLKRAGASTADGFVAVTDGDNRNIMAALIAQRMFKITRVVCRIYDPARGQMYRELGIQTVVPTTVGAKLIRDTLMEAPWDPIHSFDFGKVTSLSAKITEADAGKRVCDLEEHGLIRIAALRRETAGVMVASNDLILEVGDEINAVVAPEAIPAQRFHGATPHAKTALGCMFILIVGGGKVGSYLTRVLINKKHEVVVIEKYDKKAKSLDTLIDRKVTIVGDGCDPQVLEAAGLARADVVVADTGDDEDNLVVVLLTKKKSKARCIAGVNNPRNKQSFDSLDPTDPVTVISSTEIILDVLNEHVNAASYSVGTRNDASLRPRQPESRPHLDLKRLARSEPYACRDFDAPK